MVWCFPYTPLEQLAGLIISLTGSNALPFISTIASVSMLSLMLLGGLSAASGGASVLTAIGRVTFWGILSMAITAGIRLLFGIET